MRKFREALEDSCLNDLGFRGTAFTFLNKRLGLVETIPRLDRALHVMIG